MLEMVYIFTPCKPFVSPGLTEFYYIRQYIRKHDILYESSPWCTVVLFRWTFFIVPLDVWSNAVHDTGHPSVHCGVIIIIATPGSKRHQSDQRVSLIRVLVCQRSWRKVAINARKPNQFKKWSASHIFFAQYKQVQSCLLFRIKVLVFGPFLWPH